MDWWRVPKGRGRDGHRGFGEEGVGRQVGTGKLPEDEQKGGRGKSSSGAAEEVRESSLVLRQGGEGRVQPSAQMSSSASSLPSRKALFKCI